MFVFLMTLFLTVSVAAGGPAFAGESASRPRAGLEISLDEALHLVTNNHPDIRLQELALEKAAEEVRLSTRAFLPDVDVDYILSSATGGWGLILTAAKLLQPVFSFKKLMTEREARKILKQKEEALIRYRELEVKQSVREIYVTLLIQRKLARLLHENAKRSEERLELVRIHHQEGGLYDEAFLKEKLMFETARSEAGKAGAWLRQTEFAFRRLIGLAPDEPFSLKAVSFDKPKEFPLTLEESIGVAYAQNPIIKALLLEEKAALKRLGIKEPVFHADGAFIGLGDAGGGIFRGNPRFGFLGNLTLYDWGKERLRRRIFGLEYTELRLKHEKAFQAFESEIVKSYFEVERLQGEARESGAKSRLASESKRRAKTLDEIGRIRQTDLLSIENEYALEKSGEWQKHLEYFLIKERLVKDLGLESLDELEEVEAP